VQLRAPHEPELDLPEAHARPRLHLYRLAALGVGHELAVEVLQCGEGVSEFKPGDLCAVNPYMTCGVCAACSSGQEPYSLAMMVVEAGVELSGWSVRIIGVDLSEAVLARARKARFTQSEVNRGLPAGLLAKYFDSVEGEWQLKSIVRDRVELRQMNLIEPWPALPSIDLLFMRNVLIYFDVATKKAILARARQAMAPDGYLLLGGAETTINIDDKFESKSVGASIVYRQVGAR